MSFDKRAFWQDLLTRDDIPAAARFLNFELIAFDETEGWVEAAFTLPPEAGNPAGDGQGGFVAAMLDEVMSVAGSIVQDGPAMAPTLQMTTSFVLKTAGDLERQLTITLGSLQMEEDTFQDKVEATPSAAHGRRQ